MLQQAFHKLDLVGMQLRQTLPLTLEDPLEAKSHHQKRTTEQSAELRQETGFVLNLAIGFVLLTASQQVGHRVDHQGAGEHLAAGVGIQAAEQINPGGQLHQLVTRKIDDPLLKGVAKQQIAGVVA